MKEQSPKTGTEQEVEAFIKKNYRVSKTKVEKILSGMKFSPEYHELNRLDCEQEKHLAEAVARQYGLLSPINPDEEVSSMLSAIKMYEKKADLVDQILPLPEYVRILMRAEFTSANRDLDSLENNENRNVNYHWPRRKSG